MKRKGTQCNEAHSKAKPRIHNQVFDDSGRRIRGIWFRSGTYYAQLRIRGQFKQIPLQSLETIPQAVEAKQALKKKAKT